MSSTASDQEMPLIAHLLELRNRLMKAALAIVIAFVPLMTFSRELYAWFAKPLMKYLPQGSTMIATEIGSQFFAPLKLAFVGAIFLAIPVLIYQIWAFVAPGLYRHEKRLAVPLLVSAVALFYVGMAFAYFGVFPVVFGFFAGLSIEGVTYMPDIRMYFDFAIFLFFAFGICFEIPVAVLILVKLGVFPLEKLRNFRQYWIVASFVIAAVLTPPDPISQIMMAVPMVILYELGLLAARLLARSEKADHTAVSGS